MQEPIDNWQEQPKTQHPERIILINFGILLLYNAYAYIFKNINLLFALLLFQLLFNLVIGSVLVFFKGLRIYGVYMLLSFIMVLLIGFGLCSFQLRSIR